MRLLVEGRSGQRERDLADLLAVAFFAGAFFAGVLLAVVFVAGVFFAGVFFAAVFLAGVFLAGAAELVSSLATACPFVSPGPATGATIVPRNAEAMSNNSRLV